MVAQAFTIIIQIASYGSQCNENPENYSSKTRPVDRSTIDYRTPSCLGLAVKYLDRFSTAKLPGYFHFDGLASPFFTFVKFQISSIIYQAQGFPLPLFSYRRQN